MSLFIYIGLVGGWSRQPRGLSCSGLFSKEWFRPCVAGDEGSNPRYDDLGPVLRQVVPQCLVISWKSILPTSLVRVLFVLPTLWLVAGI